VTNLHSQANYLRIYRQQLKRELDAMGYGRTNAFSIKAERRIGAKTSSVWALAAVAMIALGLLAAQI